MDGMAHTGRLQGSQAHCKGKAGEGGSRWPGHNLQSNPAVTFSKCRTGMQMRMMRLEGEVLGQSLRRKQSASNPPGCPVRDRAPAGRPCYDGLQLDKPDEEEG